MAPQIISWLKVLDVDELVEPYAGGASVSLLALTEGLVDRIVINELDPNIYNLWLVIFSKGVELSEKVLNFDTDVDRADLLERLRSKEDWNFGNVDWAFKTLLRNRLSRNGVMTKNSGFLNKGDTGLYSRWYPETLAKRIIKIEKFHPAVTLLHTDGTQLISRRKRTAVFVDPPYRYAGKYLYEYNGVDHSEIMSKIKGLGVYGLATYDASIEILSLIKRNDLEFSRIQMLSGGNSKKIELMISRNLGWL